MYSVKTQRGGGDFAHLTTQLTDKSKNDKNKRMVNKLKTMNQTMQKWDKPKQKLKT